MAGDVFIRALTEEIGRITFRECGCSVVYTVMGYGQIGASPQSVGCRCSHRVPKPEFLRELAEQEGYEIEGIEAIEAAHARAKAFASKEPADEHDAERLRLLRARHAARKL